MQTHLVLRCPGCGSPAADCVPICPYCGRHTGFAALGLSRGVERTDDGGFSISGGAHVQLGGSDRDCPFCGASCQVSDVFCPFCRAKIVVQRMRIASLVISGGSMTITSGGSLEVIGRRRRPLHDAALAGDLEKVEAEVMAGDDPDFQDEHGRRPLHYAAREGHHRVAQWLLSVGADPDAADDGEQRPIELAARAGHDSVVQLLRQMGAEYQLADGEAARIERLRASAAEPLHPPDDLNHLFVSGRVPEAHESEARRELDATFTKVEAGERSGEHRLHYLVTAISNETWAQGAFADQVRERAAACFSHPVYRQSVLSSLCRRAIEADDREAADRWLAGLDPRPERIEADSDYRLTKALYAARIGEHREVLRLLGESMDEIPIDGAWVLLSILLRADAKERLGDLAGAREDFHFLRQNAGDEMVTRLIEFNSHLVLCPQSRHVR